MILICGASGLVGKEMCQLLDQKNINYIGTYNTNKISKNNMFKLDFNNATEIEEFMLKHEIKICIFSIVQRLTDICEKDWQETKNVNIDMVYNTSYICNKLNIKFIHISTDYVFDGMSQPNYPDSVKNPLQNYGISKLISEYRVINNCCTNYAIIRTPVLYSKLSRIHNNAVTLIGKNLMNLKNKTFVEDNYSIRRPLFIPDLCKFIYNCLEDTYHGIYHFYNPYNKFTKFEVCNKIADIIGISNDKIVANNKKSSGIAPRPYDTQLKDTRIDIEKYNFTNFDQTLNNCFGHFKFIPIKGDNVNNIFLMIDLDGTIIKSSVAHFNSYKFVFEKYGKEMCSFNEWEDIINNKHFLDYMNKVFDKNMLETVKKEKIMELNNQNIEYTTNSDKFLEYIIENNINFCIVTNTNRQTVEIFKQKCSILNKIENWVCKEDFEYNKPSSECYKLAIKKFYKNEKHIIGIEDSKVGYDALKGVTDNIYIYNNDDLFKNNDGYLFDDYDNII